MDKVAFNDLPNMDTYVYIDVSNIRAACLKTLGFRIDFNKLLQYLKQKYTNLEDVRYYEGIAIDDIEKKRHFAKLKRQGYTICSLERKSYVSPAVFKSVQCKRCGNVQKTRVQNKTIKMKSNVDVYLATDLAKVAYLAEKPTHILLVSCDGDYAETIKSAIETNPNIAVSVMATPMVKVNNSLSTRIKSLRKTLPNFQLINIGTISQYIEAQE